MLLLINYYYIIITYYAFSSESQIIIGLLLNVIHFLGGMHVTIQSGPGHSGTSNPVQIGNQSLTSNPSEQRPFRLANVVSPDHRRFLSNLYLNRELDR